MKLILLFLINLYQNFFSIFLKNLLGIQKSCKFYPSCSEYAKESIKKFGVSRGLPMALLRILKCQPFYQSTARLPAGQGRQGKLSI